MEEGDLEDIDEAEEMDKVQTTEVTSKPVFLLLFNVAIYYYYPV